MGGLYTFLVRTRKTGELSVLLRMGLVVSSLLFSVAISAKGNWDESVNLHGRYLIPFYVTLLSLCFSGYLEPLTKKAEPQQNLIEIRNSRIFQFILVTTAFLHIYSIYFLFERYFG